MTWQSLSLRKWVSFRGKPNLNLAEFSTFGKSARGKCCVLAHGISRVHLLCGLTGPRPREHPTRATK